MPSEPPPTRPSNDAEGPRDADAPLPTLNASISGLDLVFTRRNPSLVTVTEARTERWVANISQLPSGTRVIYHNFHYQKQFGHNVFDPRGRHERQAACDRAAELWAQ
jgi:hypothetical protein